jgi:cytochrome c
MKLLIKTLAMCSIILASCQSAEQQNNATSKLSSSDSTNSTRSDLKVDAEETNKNKLMAKSDCYTCHTNDTKLIGPSFMDIALKYDDNANNIKLLIDKVINGGSGVWGEVPMQSHSQMSDAEAKEMVNYILALK